METLVVVAQHKNQYYGRTRVHSGAQFGSFVSPPSKGINCRSYQSGAGILPTPLRSKSCTTPVSKRTFSASSSSVNSRSKSEEPKNEKKSVKTSEISIPIKMEQLEESFNNELQFSELWAGPTYSNSPPPSSLPLPKFFLKPKRTVSLTLPSTASSIDLDPIAKSAPVSPTHQFSLSPRDIFEDIDFTEQDELSPIRSFNDDTATKTLRRILNLDLSDE